MKKVLASAILALSFTASAQTLVNVIPATGSVLRFIVDLTDKDRLENTDPITVQSSGTGKTCEEALLNAKKFALEKVNGSWIKTTQRSVDGKYNEDIVQYSGGVIKSYKYLRNDCTFVIIEAEVMQRSNKVQLEGADVTRQQIVHIQGIKEAFDRKQVAINAIDKRSEAIYFKPKNTQMQLHPNGKDIIVSIEGTFAFTDKWRADYLALREQNGYFNLPSFEPQAKVVVTAYNGFNEKIFETSFVHEGSWVLWGRRSYGASPTMEVYTNRTEDAKVRFVVPDSKISNITKFKIEVI